MIVGVPTNGSRRPLMDSRDWAQIALNECCGQTDQPRDDTGIGELRHVVSEPNGNDQWET